VLSDKTFCFLLPKNSSHNPPKGGALKRPAGDALADSASLLSLQQADPASKRLKVSPHVEPQQPVNPETGLPPLGAGMQPAGGAAEVGNLARMPGQASGEGVSSAQPVPLQQQPQQQQQGLAVPLEFKQQQ